MIELKMFKKLAITMYLAISFLSISVVQAEEIDMTQVIANRLNSLRNILALHSYLNNKFMQIMENRQSFSEDEISRIMRLSSHLSEYIDKESNPEVINDTELYQKHQLEFFDKSEAMINHIDRKFKKMIFLYKHPKDRVDFQPNSFLQPISLR